MRLFPTLLTLVSLAGLCTAGETKSWQQSAQADFEKGTLKSLSLRSDGVLTLAPKFTERFDSSSAYLWSLARDAAGNLYTGGGPGAKLYRIAPDGRKETLAEFDALEVHAIVIDSKDQIFVATSPYGKVYKLAAATKAGAKPPVFYDPKAKYIWALALNGKGDLLVATGDPGEVHRVGMDGKGSAIYRSEDTHVRSLAVDTAKDSMIAGTEPGGLIVRVTAAGDGFVLFQTPKKEVTSIAVAKDGTIYAACAGNKQTGASLPPPQIAITAPPPAPAAAMSPRPPAAPAPFSMGTPTAV
ncbi:MAG: hypothetical protein ABIZ80_07895, partial [Bryobacteraceae bacterium]